ncbi:hypothetical protein DS63301_19 [Lactococcus phage 63301]|uniref:DUF1642 domain-containing protein n=2 Tax=root TaxID=1 RepID=UPI0007AE44D0|nr:DUF1642 domain-containing protein [Lactococcus phage 63301]ANS02616.2 hypothetical protein DS63301_19 [Lactococcus phage 63301]
MKMTKFEEEVKRPKKAYIDPFSKRDVDFTGLAKKFTEGAQTLKEWKEYAFLLEDKLKLQQKALPVVPDFIGKLINTFGAPEDGKHINYSASYLEFQKELDWIDNHQKTWLTALLIGFRVEKPQLFYLKHIDFCKTDKHDDWFTIKHSDGPLNHLRVEKGEKPSTIDCKFTQQEIDSMQTGSYEQIPVEDGE